MFVVSQISSLIIALLLGFAYLGFSAQIFIQQVQTNQIDLSVVPYAIKPTSYTILSIAKLENKAKQFQYVSIHRLAQSFSKPISYLVTNFGIPPKPKILRIIHFVLFSRPPTYLHIM